MKKLLKVSLAASITVVCASGTVLAAEDKKAAAPKPVKIDVDLQTRYTRGCKSMAATAEPEKRDAKGMPEPVYKRLVRSQERMAEDQFQEALDILLPLYERNKDDNFLRATLGINLGQLYINLNEIPKAMEFFQVALDAKALPINQEQSARLNLASYNYGEERFEIAEKLVREWFKYETKPNATGYTLLAGIYGQKGELDKAICPAYLATTVSPEHKSSVFQLLLAAHSELKDRAGTLKIGRAMVQVWPDEAKYWRVLAALYAGDEQYDNSLAVLALLYRQGKFEKADDYKQLSSLYATQSVPNDAAIVLKEGIDKGLVESDEKNWKAVAQNFHAANELEKAIEAYEKAAAFTDDGEYYAKQGTLYGQLEQWSSAIKAFDKALQRGNLEKPGKVVYDKGIAQYYLNDFDAAIATLNRAAEYSEFRKRAKNWADYAQRRKDVLEELRTLAVN